MYKLSPSDFKYLYEDCKHCYYLKVKKGITLPSIGMPGVFSKMNSLLQNAIVGMELKEINSLLPAGKVEIKEGFLKSKPIPPDNSCFISGRFDIASELDDGTYAVVDFKITDPKEDQAKKFSSQLHAYKYAMENPANGFVEPKTVSKMGLITIAPESIELNGGKVVFNAMPKWHDIPTEMDSFYSLISEISGVLNSELPEPSENCAWCQYRTKFNGKSSSVDDIPF